MKDTPTSVLCWPKKLLSADDLRRHLTSQRELVLLPRTVVTPLAADELRAKGVRIRWEQKAEATPKTASWFYAQEKPTMLVSSVVQALEGDGIQLAELSGSPRSLAETLVANYVGGVIFTGDAAIAMCIANKVAGVRAAYVVNVIQATRAKKNLGANLFAIEMPGPTFFEMRQMLKTIVTSPVQCPDEVVKTLKELDGHAHR
jgi:ribose 5-phosphate isomerase RpiB